MIKPLPCVLLATVVTGVATAQTINLGNFVAGDASSRFSIDLDGAGVPPGVYSSVTLTFDWSPESGSPYSNEARFVLANDLWSNGPTTFYVQTSVGPSGSASDGSPRTGLSWNLPLLNYRGGYPLYLTAWQSYAGSSANWSNVTVQLNLIPRPPIAQDLGVVADETQTFSIDTFSSALDTEIGLYDSISDLVANNDQAGGTDQSELPGLNLAPGLYYLAVGEFNMSFFNAFNATSSNSLGFQTGGTISGQVNGTPFSVGVAIQEVKWIRFEIAAAPPSCATDLDNDGDTDVFDFATFAANFGQSVPPGTGGDYDSNGMVDVFDFATFAADFGCSP